jgi:hypothetical protein
MSIINTVFPQSGSNTSDATATASQILSPYTAYVASGKVTGTIPTQQQATPSISVSSSGLITASVTQQTGYISGGTTNETEQLNTKSGTTITPGTNQQTAISAGTYATGNIYVSGSTNLIPENIKSGISIFGVLGSLEAQSVKTLNSSGEVSINLSQGIVTLQGEFSYFSGYISGEDSSGYANKLYILKIESGVASMLAQDGFNGSEGALSISYSGGNTTLNVLSSSPKLSDALQSVSGFSFCCWN